MGIDRAGGSAFIQSDYGANAKPNGASKPNGQAPSNGGDSMKLSNKSAQPQQSYADAAKHAADPYAADPDSPEEYIPFFNGW